MSIYERKVHKGVYMVATEGFSLKQKGAPYRILWIVLTSICAGDDFPITSFSSSNDHWFPKPDVVA
jgi:hypothetical protein